LSFQRLYGCSGSLNNKTDDEVLSADVNWGFRARMVVQPAWDAGQPQPPTVLFNGTWLNFTTYAVDATASTPTSSAITAHAATIADNYFPNTNVSSATVWLEYRKLGDTTWIQAGSTDTGKQGYSQLSISRNLTGLLAQTTYEYRLSMTRNTVNSTSLSSGISTFTTPADTPSITTNAATNIAARSVQLNGTVNPNTVACRTRFGWGTSDAGAGTWPNYTPDQNFSGSGAQGFSAQITGLNPSATYFFRAICEFP
jgi:hypothetical protein